MTARRLCLAALLAAACTAPSEPATKPDEPAANRAAAPAPPSPPEPGTPGGLADDRTPVAEAPFAETSGRGAAQVVQTYYALIESGRYPEARALWPGEASASDAAFAAGFAPYAEYHARIGAPGEIEGAAGSLYVDVPVLLYGRRKDGGKLSREAIVTLRRVNDVPGSTAAQRRWHIYRIEESSVSR